MNTLGKTLPKLLFVDGIRFPDPFSFHERWLSEQDGMKSWLPIYMTNIVQYAGVSDSNVNMCNFYKNTNWGKDNHLLMPNMLRKYTSTIPSLLIHVYEY